MSWREINHHTRQFDYIKQIKNKLIYIKWGHDETSGPWEQL